ncbi:MAG: DEAD/DEAH box helicase [Planctomycetota bacterium]|nr:DEAD/DEAH box helicase [Planctomycetota bacterium]MEC9049047.1 DEAD/DEAH box helicase [Planctomycetota bacterium]
MSQDFASLGVRSEILDALKARGYETPTPIQAGSIPQLLDGADLLGIAQTGTGKTAAFSIPMLQILYEEDERPRPGRPRALVLAPTRELALQIRDACVDYGNGLGLVTALVFGGVGQMPQVKALQKGVDILVATPGRLLDLMSQGHCKLGDVDILVLDEADRMLDMGFLPDVRRILQKCPKERQSLLFSATMPDDITALANKFLFEPVRVEVTPPAATADRVEQSVYHVQKSKKRDLLVKLLEDPAFVRTLVFTRTKHGADRVAKHLVRARIPAHAIHGNKSQGARERALGEFRDGKAIVLVATDIAARGIDVPEISHVVNFDLPNVPESYVHRIGRTARAGRAGIAISFCDEGEHEYLRSIQKLIKQRIPSLRQQDIGKRHPEPEQGERPDERPRRKRPTDDSGKLRPEPRHAPGPYANSDEVRSPRRPTGGRGKGKVKDEERRRRGEARPGGRRARAGGQTPTKPAQGDAPRKKSPARKRGAKKAAKKPGGRPRR